MTETAKRAVTVRLPPAMVKRLRAAAETEGATVTALVLRACEAAPWGREPAERCAIHRTPLRAGACQECDGGLY
jgi:hypothetical protein